MMCGSVVVLYTKNTFLHREKHYITVIIAQKHFGVK